MAVESEDLLARIRAEHERVMKGVREIQAIIGAETPMEQFPRWRLGLLQLLGDLSNDLVKHFNLEEEGGFMSAVLSMAPQNAQIVERLRREHVEIARGLNKVVMDVEAVRHGDDRSVLDIQRETTAVLSLLVAHEATEETLIQETYLQDEGEHD